MKSTEPAEAAGKPEHPQPAEPRVGGRNRQEHVLRPQFLRRQQPSAEPLRDGDVPLGTALSCGAEEPLIGLDDGAPVDDTIIGNSDRAHHLAMAPGLSPVTVLRPRISKNSSGDTLQDTLVLPPGPKSRAECRRRCGKAGFCDPSSEMGCGGEYCGNAGLAMRDAL